MDDRVIELETKLAFQEDTLQTLDQVVVRQQADIDGLTKEVKKLHVQMKQMTSLLSEAAPDEAPPPHY